MRKHADVICAEPILWFKPSPALTLTPVVNLVIAPVDPLWGDQIRAVLGPFQNHNFSRRPTHTAAAAKSVNLKRPLIKHIDGCF